MLEPITTTIVAALVAGAEAGATVVATQAITDSYNALKAAIAGKFSAIDIVAFEKKPNSEARQEVLAEELEEAGADKDEELKAKAVALIDAVEDLRSHPKAAALFDFGKLRAAKNFELTDIKTISTVLRADEAIFEGDFKASNIEQTGGSAASKH